MVKKISKGLLALCLAVFMTGCGSEPAEIADYGNGTEGTVSGTSTVTEGESEDKSEDTTDNDKTEKADKAEVEDGSLADKLGGTECNWDTSFTASGVSIDVKAHIEINDTEQLPSYKISTVEESEMNEEGIVKNLLGDSAKKLDRELSIDDGDSELVIQGICRLYLRYRDNGGEQPQLGEVITTAPGWVDEEKYFVHTYEGTNDGVDYQLFLGYDKENKVEHISFFPKTPGECIGKPDLDYVTEYWVEDGLASLPDIKEFLGELKTGSEAEPELREAEGMFREKLGLKIPDNFIFKDEYEYTSEYVLYLSRTEMRNIGYNSVEELENIYDLKDVLEKLGPDYYAINGYEAVLGEALANQYFYYDITQGTGGLTNGGTVFFTDNGVMGYSLTIDKEFDDVLSDNVPVIDYDSVILAFEDAVTENLDPTQCPSNDMKYEYARIVYYPVQSPDNPGESTLIPAWEFTPSDYGAVVLINAMDGSLLDIVYEKGM